VNAAPLIVTLVPTGPLTGVKLAIAGGTTTVNTAALVAVPAEVVTLIAPVLTGVKLSIAGGLDTVTVTGSE
jgi:hypothetical protein